MIIEHKENINSDFEGTVIDIETIGEFLNQYPDSRRYKGMHLVIFGFINRDALHILCAKGLLAIDELKERIDKIMDSLERPFYAFNTDFERGVLFYDFGKKIDFDGELQKEKFESKIDAVRDLDISNYDDPFYGRGFPCIKAWKDGEFDSVIAHNRACILKERDILIKRKFRKPDELHFVK